MVSVSVDNDSSGSYWKKSQEKPLLISLPEANPEIDRSSNPRGTSEELLPFSLSSSATASCRCLLMHGFTPIPRGPNEAFSVTTRIAADYADDPGVAKRSPPTTVTTSPDDTLPSSVNDPDDIGRRAPKSDGEDKLAIFPGPLPALAEQKTRWLASAATQPPILSSSTLDRLESLWFALTGCERSRSR